MMRTVVVATGDLHSMTALTERHPLPALPIMDRPIIIHLVAHLAAQGINEFDFILSHLPEKLETLLQNGEQWGCTFRFHLAKNADQPYGALKSLGQTSGDDPVLLCHADRLPLIDVATTMPSSERPAPVMFYLRGKNTPGEDEWTGWAWFPWRLAADLPAAADEKDLQKHLVSLARDHGTIVDVDESLNVRSYDRIIDSQNLALSGGFPGLICKCRQTKKGIWISKNVTIHPTARLVPPVFIGQNCRIEAGAKIGPNTAIGMNCIFGPRCLVEDSLIFTGSSVGEALELERVIVDGNRLINARMDTEITVTDNFILGSRTDSDLAGRIRGAFTRLCAAILLIVLSPLLIVTALLLRLFRNGPVLHKMEAVRLPAPSDNVAWRTVEVWSFQCPAEGRDERSAWNRSTVTDMLLRFLPALVNVVRGEIGFVGVPPRTREEVAVLPMDWKTLYLGAKTGIVTEADVHYGRKPTDDELYAAEAVYAATIGIGHDLKLLGRYLGNMSGLTTVVDD